MVFSRRIGAAQYDIIFSHARKGANASLRRPA
jgi:hypothetical protein